MSGSFQTWTATIAPGQTLCVSIPMDALEDGRITNASLGARLSNPSEKSRSSLLFAITPDSRDGCVTVPLTTLIPYRYEQTALDILLPKGYKYELHCQGDNAISVAGHHAKEEVNIFFQEGSEDGEATPKPSNSKDEEVSNPTGGTSKVRAEAPKNKRRRKATPAEDVVPTTAVINAHTKKKGDKPYIALQQGQVVEYSLHILVGEHGGKSDLKGRIVIDQSKTHKTQQKFLLPYLLGLGRNGTKKLTVPPSCHGLVKGCSFGRLTEGCAVMIEIKIDKLTEGSSQA
ncbi:hypothetical protein FB107DRAFT_280517 [Schizophyllum commune]